MNQVRELNFRHFHTSFHGPHLGLSKSCFQLWRNIWQPLTSIHEHDFLHKELGGLFLGDQPVGFLLYQFCDLTKPIHQKMSYFANYPSQLYAEMIEEGERVMIASALTVDPHWRKLETDMPLSELLVGFAILRFLQSDARRMVGSFQIQPGAKEIFLRHGGQSLDSHFAQILRESARLSTLQPCPEMTMKLWNQFMKKKRDREPAASI